ncbi:MAG: branched-chain amino acid ABC transporter permease [Faecousia sp.]
MKSSRFGEMSAFHWPSVSAAARRLFKKGEWIMTASLFVQGLINGLNQGAIYALIALGYTMVYGIIRMINFAHGDFIMIGAYALFYTIPLMVNAGMPAWMAVIIAIVVCALVGVLVEILAYKPVRKAGSMSALITALAMSIFLENLAMVLFGAKPHNVQAIFELPTVRVGSVALPLNVLLYQKTSILANESYLLRISMNRFIKNSYKTRNHCLPT